MISGKFFKIKFWKMETVNYFFCIKFSASVVQMWLFR